MADLVIKSGQVIDGTGKPAVMGDIVISEGSFFSVGDGTEVEGNLEWDASGKVVCPGFIDIHSLSLIHI